MTKISVVSTFHAPVLDLYGQRFIDSFSKNIDSKIELLLYAEDCVPTTNDSRITILDQKENLPKLNAFKEYWKNDPRANGIPPDDIKRKRKDWNKTFKWDAIRFANKVYAVFDAAKRTDADWLFWMDADTFVHSYMPQEAFEKHMSKKAWLCYLGRGKKWPECGFYGINLKHSTGQEFLKEFEHVYEHAEYGIFRMDEWHDSFVFEEVRKKIYANYPNDAIINISKDLVNGEGHPLINSDLGRYLDHLKGDRKNTGKSKQTDLIVKRNESYWQ